MWATVCADKCTVELKGATNFANDLRVGYDVLLSQWMLVAPVQSKKKKKPCALSVTHSSCPGDTPLQPELCHHL